MYAIDLLARLTTFANYVKHAVDECNAHRSSTYHSVVATGHQNGSLFTLFIIYVMFMSEFDAMKTLYTHRDLLS